MRKLILCIAMLGVLSAAKIGFARNATTTSDAVGDCNANFELQNTGKDTAKESGKMASKSKKEKPANESGKDQRPVGLCCSISKIDIRAGLVTAQVNGTGQVFQFKVTDANLLATLHVAQPIYANFSTRQVSVDGIAPSGSIVSSQGSQSSAMAVQSEQTSQHPQNGSSQSQGKPGSQKPIDHDRKDLHADRKDARNDRKDERPAPCCAIAKIDLQAGLVTAQVNGTGQIFLFKVTDANLLATLHLAQPIYANFIAQQVSADGVTACCHIQNQSSGVAVQSEQTSRQPQTGNSQNKSKPGSQKPTDAEKNTIGAGSSGMQPSEPTTETAIRAAAAGGPPQNNQTPEINKPEIGTGRTSLQFPAPANTNQPQGLDKAATPQLTAAATVASRSGAATPATAASLQLSDLECTPGQLASGDLIFCDVKLNGKVPLPIGAKLSGPSSSPPAQAQITTDKPLIAASQTVTFTPGTSDAKFKIATNADAQGGPLTISAAYQSSTRSVAVRVTPSLLKDVKCFDNGGSALDPSVQSAYVCTITPWSGKPYGLIAYATQPPGQAITIPITEPGRLHHDSSTGSVVIPANQAFGGVWYPSDYGGIEYSCFQGRGCDYFEPVPQTENHNVTVRDPVSGLPHSVGFKVLPAAIVGLGFGDMVGTAQNSITVNSRPRQKLTVWVSFNAPPAPTDWNSQNAWLDVVYGGPTDPSRGSVAIQGPTNLGIQEQDCSIGGPILAGAPNITPDQSSNTICVWSPNVSPGTNRPALNAFSFQITVGACSKLETANGCQATLTVSSNQALGRQVATINVVPQ